MGTEEKARAYDEVRKKIALRFGSDVAEEIFSEFEMSEDEKIRKEIISHLKYLGKYCQESMPNVNEWIAWLEKQGDKKSFDDLTQQEAMDIAVAKCFEQDEQNPTDKVEPKIKVKYAGCEYNVLEVKDIVGVTYYGIEDEPNHIDWLINVEVIDDEKKELNKIEQKSSIVDFKAEDWYVSKVDGKIHNIYNSVDRIEPKFKIGDIIINIHYKWDGKHRIREITDGKYIFDDGSYITIKEQDNWELVDKSKPKFKVGDLIRLKDGDGLEWTIKEMHHDGYYTIVCEDRDDFIYLDDRWELVGKLVDKIEAKFHEGEWVVQGYNILKIKCVGDTYYCFETVSGYVDDMLISEIDSQFHLWTIQDAKDGDVLVASDDSLFIFAKVKDNSAYYYFSLCTNGSKEISDGNHAWETASSCHPATKEQRDTLMKAMADAGWEFDFEKKELKKISQRMVSAEAKEALYDKPTDEEMKELLRTEYEKGRADAIAEMKSSWSEKDEKVIAIINNALTESNTPPDDYDKVYDWLESLRKRIGE